VRHREAALSATEVRRLIDRAEIDEEVQFGDRSGV
jgi:hypothetical protein